MVEAMMRISRLIDEAEHDLIHYRERRLLIDAAAVRVRLSALREALLIIGSVYGKEKPNDPE